MGGSDPLFEEAKMTGEGVYWVERTYQMFNAHPIYCCTALGSFILTVLIYIFMQR